MVPVAVTSLLDRRLKIPSTVAENAALRALFVCSSHCSVAFRVLRNAASRAGLAQEQARCRTCVLCVGLNIRAIAG